jgi:polysaccharide biosynthesis/export protein
MPLSSNGLRIVAFLTVSAGSCFCAGTVPEGLYLLGPEDQLSISVPDAEEVVFEKVVRIDPRGLIHIGIIGAIQAGGLTTTELEAALSLRLQTYIRKPIVTVTILEFGSQRVTVVGAVRNPGVVELRGPRSLLDVLSMVGGVRDDAGPTIKVTRPIRDGVLPLAQVETNTEDGVYIGQVDYASLLAVSSPANNFILRGGDVVTVPTADIVYVLGAVNKPGGFVVRQHEQLSVLVALSLAEGFTRTASAKRAKILRTQVGMTERVSIPINLIRIEQGEAPDTSLRTGDILLVPTSYQKNAAMRVLESAIQIGTGIAIFRP